MRPPVPTHPDDDRLLELAYGEVPASEARTLRQHVDGCARCRQWLDGIAEVRTAFRSIPGESPPERGLESLLAYGEQAAARARSRRGGLRILGLLSAAAAFALVWLVVPGSHRPSDGLARAPAPAGTDMLAQAEAPRSVAQGDRARDEVDPAKDAKQNERKAPTLPLTPMPLAKAKAEAERQDRPAAAPARRAEPATPPPEEKAVAKLDAPKKEERPKREQPAGSPSDLEVASRSSAAGNLSGAVAVGGKAGAAGASSTAGASSLMSAESASGAAKKRTATGTDDFASNAAGAPASPPAPSQSRGEEGRVHDAARVVAAPMADAVASEDKALSTAKTASKPAPAMQSMRMGAGSPEKATRLAEVKRQLTTATGDTRKGLLMEQCELEASLQLGPDAVLSCSKVTQEFPGTPEAKRAGEIARGFSVQLPAKQER
jgi:hypothetical protein